MLLRDFQEKFSYLIPFSLIEKNDIENFKTFLETKPDLNITDENNNTLLIFATKKGNIEIIKLLLENNISINVKDKTGDTALSWAAYYQRDDIVKLLLAYNASVHEKNNNQDTPLMECLRKDLVNNEKRRAILNLLLESKANINTQNEKGSTPLLRLTTHKFGIDDKTIELLLEAKADVNIKDKRGHTAFMLYKGYKDITAKMLLSQAAEVNTQDEDGNTALMHACFNDCRPLIKALIDAKADVNVQNKKNQIAYDFTTYETAKDILIKANPNNTCLHKLFSSNVRPLDKYPIEDKETNKPKK